MTTQTLDRPQCCGVTMAEPGRETRTYRPNVDIFEGAEEITVRADLPGASPEGVDVKFEKGTLTLHAAVPPRNGQANRIVRHEYGIGDFHRTFQLGEGIDAARISAEIANGVLTLHLPKVESVKPRKITVRTPSA